MAAAPLVRYRPAQFSRSGGGSEVSFFYKGDRTIATLTMESAQVDAG